MFFFATRSQHIHTITIHHTNSVVVFCINTYKKKNEFFREGEGGEEKRSLLYERVYTPQDGVKAFLFRLRVFENKKSVS